MRGDRHVAAADSAFDAEELLRALAELDGRTRALRAARRAWRRAYEQYLSTQVRR